MGMLAGKTGSRAKGGLRTHLEGSWLGFIRTHPSRFTQQRKPGGLETETPGWAESFVDPALAAHTVNFRPASGREKEGGKQGGHDAKESAGRPVRS